MKIIEMDQEYLMLFLKALKKYQYLPISNAAVSLERLSKNLKSFVSPHENN